MSRPNFVYAIDLREPDTWDFDGVGTWAKLCDATVDLVFADPHGSFSTDHVLSPKLRKQLDDALTVARTRDTAALEDLLTRLPEDHRGKSHIVGGDPRAVIPEYADDYDALLVTTRDRKGLRRAFLGSVAERIVRHTTVPVIIAR